MLTDKPLFLQTLGALLALAAADSDPSAKSEATMGTRQSDKKAVLIHETSNSCTPSDYETEES